MKKYDSRTLGNVFPQLKITSGMTSEGDVTEVETWVRKKFADGKWYLHRVCVTYREKVSMEQIMKMFLHDVYLAIMFWKDTWADGKCYLVDGFDQPIDKPDENQQGEEQRLMPDWYGKQL